MFKIRAALIPSCLRLVLVTSVVVSDNVFSTPSEVPDPCAAIAGKVWVPPQDVRACFVSFDVDPEIKANVNRKRLCTFPDFCLTAIFPELDHRRYQQDLGIPYLCQLSDPSA
jgi:hypothetical protein